MMWCMLQLLVDLSAKQSKLAAPVAFGVGMLIYLQLQTTLSQFMVVYTYSDLMFLQIIS